MTTTAKPIIDLQSNIEPVRITVDTTMVATADTVTREQIKALRSEAMARGDYRTADTCDVALSIGEDHDPQTAEFLVDSDGNPTTRTKARSFCADVINWGNEQEGES